MTIARSLIGFVATALVLSAGWPVCDSHAAGPRLAGPNGGRIVQGPGGTQAEFHVGADRIARVRALGADRKPIATDKMTASLRIPKPRATIAFTRTGAAGAAHLVASSALPAGDPYPVVLTLKSGKKTVNVRFTINMETCGGCSLAEYACICDH